jgi:hypothetical protein
MAKRKMTPTYRSDAELKTIYGKHAIISRVGKYNLIHLDYPSPQEIRSRIEEIKSGGAHDGDDDCPLCRAQKEMGGEVVYSCQGWCPECEKKDTCQAYNPDLAKIEEELSLIDSDDTRPGGPLDPNQILNPWERSYGDVAAVAFSPPREAAFLLAHIIGGHLPELRDDLRAMGTDEQKLEAFKEIAWDIPSLVLEYIESNSSSRKRKRIGTTIDTTVDFVSAYEKEPPLQEKIPDLKKKLEMLKEIVNQMQ